jgi:two-component system LytT family response regulator
MSIPTVLTALIVDDEKSVREVLIERLQHFSFVTVVGEAASVAEAVREINRTQPNLVFLDIEMPGYSGLQLLEFFHPQQVNFDIVFVTAFNQYAIQAFKLSAFDYLLKPLNPLDLEQTLNRYLRQRTSDSTISRAELLKQSLKQVAPIARIAVSSVQGIDFVQLSDLVVLEASGAYTNLHMLSGETIVASKPLGEFEELLQANGQFFRTHRTFLINLAHVKNFSSKEGDIIHLSNGREVPLSRYRKSEFETAIGGLRI